MGPLRVINWTGTSGKSEMNVVPVASPGTEIGAVNSGDDMGNMPDWQPVITRNSSPRKAQSDKVLKMGRIV